MKGPEFSTHLPESPNLTGKQEKKKRGGQEPWVTTLRLISDGEGKTLLKINS